MMTKIKVISYKYNGALRSECESYLVAEDEAAITLWTPPGTLDFSAKKGTWLPAPDGLLELYFKHKWYNVWHICEQHSGFNQSYANIAMPATLQANVLTWVDLDLDLRVHMDGSIELLDEDEFLTHSTLFPYPPAVITQARAAVDELMTCYQQGIFPFTYAAQVARYEQIKAANQL
jgi:protein associated with RNAse G/E